MFVTQSSPTCKFPMVRHYVGFNCQRRNVRRCLTCFAPKFRMPQQRCSSFNGWSSNSKGMVSLIPGATMATLLMLGLLHARRLYDETKVDDARKKGIELEFQPEFRAMFLKLLPLRSISRIWGSITNVELPIFMRPYVYRAWARAFHSNLEEASLSLENYVSLREFFVRSLKQGCRPINPDPQCLVSPVDGTILGYGELRGGSGAMIEQVKGFSYSVISLLGTNSTLPTIPRGHMSKDGSDQNGNVGNSSNSRIPLTSEIKGTSSTSSSSTEDLYFCVLYLRPGDYHRIHSPIDWHILIRRHFSGHLYPTNQRASRTIYNLYVENERVVLEGYWQGGFMAMAAIGATNVGSIELFIEPELKTNLPGGKLWSCEDPAERSYEPEGLGKLLRKGEEVGAFNLGSTVVLVFQAPTQQAIEIGKLPSKFEFSVQRGDRIQFGEALGRWP